MKTIAVAVKLPLPPVNTGHPVLHGYYPGAPVSQLVPKGHTPSENQGTVYECSFLRPIPPRNSVKVLKTF